MIFHVTNAIPALDVGQLSEYCQPEILHYHQTVLPVVFGALEVNTVTRCHDCYQPGCIVQLSDPLPSP